MHAGVSATRPKIARHSRCGSGIGSKAKVQARSRQARGPADAQVRCVRQKWLQGGGVHVDGM